MKKLISFVLSLTLLICLIGCSVTVETNIYDKLNNFASKSYRNVALEVTNETQGLALKSSFSLKEDSLTYSIEKLNLLPENGEDFGEIPEFKSTVSGTAVIENGNIVKLDGTDVQLPSYDVLTGAFNFEESNFKNAKEYVDSFSAEVISATAFLGTEADVKNMSVVVEFNSAAFEKITLVYNTDNAKITLVYNFS